MSEELLLEAVLLFPENYELLELISKLFGVAEEIMLQEFGSIGSLFRVFV
jgi:hypothetical protein